MIRRFRPAIVLAPRPDDLHPDHAHARGPRPRGRVPLRASRSSGAAARRTVRAPSCSTPRTRTFAPSLVVDVSEHFAAKKHAALAYKSQFFDPASKEPATYISSSGFWDWWEARARHYGNLVGATYGEPFLVDGPLLVKDPVAQFVDFGYYPKMSRATRIPDEPESRIANGPRQRRLRIGVSCYPTVGGSGTVAVELASALAARGHLVHVVSYESPVRLRPRRGLFFHEVDVSDYPLFKYPPYVMALSSRLSDVAIRYQLDIIHAHYAIPHSISAFLAREIVGGDRPRVVTTLHGTDITLIGSDPAYRPITKFALEQSDVVTAPSRWLKDADRARHLRRVQRRRDPELRRRRAGSTRSSSRPRAGSRVPTSGCSSTSATSAR